MNALLKPLEMAFRPMRPEDLDALFADLSAEMAQGVRSA